MQYWLDTEVKREVDLPSLEEVTATGSRELLERYRLTRDLHYKMAYEFLDRGITDAEAANLFGPGSTAATVAWLAHSTAVTPNLLLFYPDVRPIAWHRTRTAPNYDGTIHQPP